MSCGRRARVLGIILLAVIIVALPIAGCGKKQTADPGSQTQGGGAAPGGGTGIPTASGKTWAYGQLKPGQYVKYTHRAEYQGAVQTGWFSWDITDAGGGQLKIAYVGEFADLDYDDSATVSAQNALAEFAAVPLPIYMVPLLGLPWSELFADCPWSVGSKWSCEAQFDLLRKRKADLEVTGTAIYAGIDGFAGTWTRKSLSGPVITTSWCVNPDLPMVLYARICDTSPGVYEYTLVEASGF